MVADAHPPPVRHGTGATPATGQMFERVLVANRGEIAVRIIRTLHALGIEAVAVVTPDDADALHARRADLAVSLPEGGYLDPDAVVRAALRGRAQALHPGYGFLSESPDLARACGAAGVTFIGPPISAIVAMGDKITAKRTVARAGVPVVPGVHEPGMSDDDLVAAAPTVGYPLLVKAAAGGGGTGMRVVRDPLLLRDALGAARREAAGAFGDDELLLERYVGMARHLEIQVLADGHGTVWGLTERECSLQRRHQKVVEESPSPVLHPQARARMTAAAVDAARACGYQGAGTVEMILPGDTAGKPDAEAFFLEMNTRLQVEHPVSEALHRIDLVEWQLRIAAGQPLPSEMPPPAGHAVEARVYAEDPARGFLPTGGRVAAYREPQGVRVDSGIDVGSVVGTQFDPMLAKVVAHADDRAAALRRLRQALADLVVLGVPTNVPFLRAVLAHDDVRAGRLDTGLLERDLDALVSDPPLTTAQVAAVAALVDAAGEPPTSGWRLADPAPVVLRLHIGAVVHSARVATTRRGAATVIVDDGVPVQVETWPLGAGRVRVALDGLARRWDIARDADGATLLGFAGHQWRVEAAQPADAVLAWGAEAGVGPVVAPMPGAVSVVDVEVGDRVAAGQRLLVVEAMKMEHPVVATVDGVVERVAVAAGDRVGMQQPLVVVRPDS